MNSKLLPVFILLLMMGCNGGRVQELEAEVSDLRSQLADVRLKLNDIESDADDLGRSVDELNDAVSAFAYDDWQSAVFAVTNASGDVHSAQIQIQSSIQDALMAAQ